MQSYHRRLFAFDHWANLVSCEAVAEHADRLPRSLAWLNHIVGAKRIWLARVTGAPMPFNLNPTFPIEELRAQLVEARDGWDSFLASRTDADLSEAMPYTNLKGDPFVTPLVDILAHLPIHGQHHRGQINADLRAAGVTPPPIDYIHAARTGQI